MMKAFVATVLLLNLAACSSMGADTSSPPGTPVSGKATLPPVPPPPPIPDDRIVCPADVKLCADGSYVSRDAAKKCAFKPCPGETKQ